MPLYEYQCEKCGGQFEVMQKFADEPLTTHDVCGGPVHRLISAPALQFKGSGWYVTDYARAGKSGKNGESGKAEGGSDKGKSETLEKKETAPAASSGTADKTSSSSSASDNKSS